MMRMSEQQWDMVINVNLKSAFNFIHACTPVMMRQKAGSIINMASVVGVHGNAGQANYAASSSTLVFSAFSSMTRSVNAMFAPSAANFRAIALPIPRAAHSNLLLIPPVPYSFQFNCLT